MESADVEIVLTKDGSPTLRTTDGITYHSTHGAIQESMHVFVESGFREAARQFPTDEIHVFEMGFGTGLNAFLTALEMQKTDRTVHYVSVEKYPVLENIWSQLTYARSPEEKALFNSLHQAPWDQLTTLFPQFTLQKIKGSLEEIFPPERIYLVYFDAFAPEANPELWTPAIFRKLFDALLPNGILTTYCSKGIVRRALQEVGFLVEKLPGPPGKREIVRARKPL